MSMTNSSEDEETINCLLCQGVVLFSPDDQSRYKDHLSREHRVSFYISWIIQKTIDVNHEDAAVEMESSNNRKVQQQAEIAKNMFTSHPSITITSIKSNLSASFPTSSPHNNIKEASNNIVEPSSDSYPVSEFPVETELIEYDENSMYSEEDGSTSSDMSLQLHNGQMQQMDPSTYVDEEVPHKNNDLTEARIMKRTTVRGRKLYFCSLCPHLLFFQNIQQVERHQKTHIPLSHRKNFQCETCKERFCSQKNLKTHTEKNMCRGIRYYNCAKCSEYFDNRFDLNQHEESHAELKRKLSCHLCGAMFKQQKYLNKHITRAHSSVRPFKCDICGKAFKSEYYVKQHRMNHFNRYGSNQSPSGNSIKPSILGSLLNSSSTANNSRHEDDLEEEEEDPVECITDLQEIDGAVVKTEAEDDIAEEEEDANFIHIECD